MKTMKIMKELKKNTKMVQYTTVKNSMNLDMDTEDFHTLMAVFMKVNGSSELWMDMENCIIQVVNKPTKVNGKEMLLTETERFITKNQVISKQISTTPTLTILKTTGRNSKANLLKISKKVKELLP